MDQLHFDGQVIVVSGAGRGLGRQHALAFAERGAIVVVNDIGVSLGGESESKSPAAELVEQINSCGGVAIADYHDVSSPESASKIIESAITNFGRIDVVINNAGVLNDKSFLNIDEGAFKRVMDVHLGGSFWLTHAAWKHFKNQNYGRVVMTTSVAGYLGNFGQANYGSAKAAIMGLTKTLAIEGERYQIKVNAVAPGAKTRMTENLLGELGGMLGPEFVSPVVLALAHSSCNVSGEVFLAAGGRVARVFSSQNLGIFSKELTPEFVAQNFDLLVSQTERLPVETVDQEMQVLIDLLKSHKEA
jgi:NAD(P)-dependent dehydrogenase (short-subunit alcohol dehydrogenase family)